MPRKKHITCTSLRDDLEILNIAKDEYMKALIAGDSALKNRETLDGLRDTFETLSGDLKSDIESFRESFEKKKEILDVLERCYADESPSHFNKMCSTLDSFAPLSHIAIMNTILDFLIEKYSIVERYYIYTMLLENLFQNLEYFSNLDKNIAYKLFYLIRSKDSKLVLYSPTILEFLQRFEPSTHPYIAEQLIDTNQYKILEEELPNFSSFTMYTASKLISHCYGSRVFECMKNIERPNYEQIVSGLMKSGQGDVLMLHIKKFPASIDRIDIVNRLLERDEIQYVVRSLENLQGMPNNVAKAVINYTSKDGKPIGAAKAAGCLTSFANPDYVRYQLKLKGYYV